MHTLARLFLARVADFRQPVALCLPVEASCAELIERMGAAGSPEAVLIDAERRPLGIVTEQDVVRRIAFAARAETPLGEVMSRPVRSVRPAEPLFRAVAEMRRAGLGRLAVVDGDGRLGGLLRLAEALAGAGAELLGEADRLARPDTPEGLAESKAAEPALAAAMLAAGLEACEVQTVLTALNNDLYRRVVARCIDEMRAAGRGDPPVAFDCLVMGSGGRGESFLDPDQDNGLVLADYPDAEHPAIDAWFVELAERICALLERTGFPRCHGNVMAINPLWRKTLAQWRAQIAHWMGHADAYGLRMCDIFFDFAAVHGEGRLAARLREHVTAHGAHPHFLRELYRVDEGHGVALGLFGRLRPDPLPGPHQGELNLKLTGTLPLVGAVRLLALRERIPETGTLARIEALAGRGVLGRDEQDYLSAALRLLTGLILRQQLTALERGREPTHHLPPGALTTREHEALVAGLRAIRRLRVRVREELAVRV